MANGTGPTEGSILQWALGIFGGIIVAGFAFWNRLLGARCVDHNERLIQHGEMIAEMRATQKAHNESFREIKARLRDANDKLDRMKERK